MLFFQAFISLGMVKSEIRNGKPNGLEVRCSEVRVSDPSVERINDNLMKCYYYELGISITHVDYLVMMDGDSDLRASGFELLSDFWLRISDLLLINAHAGWREVEPNPMGSHPTEMIIQLRTLIQQMVAVLDELAAFRQESPDFPGEIIGNNRPEVEQWQTRHHRGDPCAWADMLFQKRV
jgi:hypothetical protein